MSTGGGGVQTTGSTQRSEPWSAQQPYIKEQFQEAQNLYNAPGPSFYGGQTYAGFAPQQEAALQAGEQRALAGSPLLQGAQDLAGQTIGGEFLSAGNPYFQDMMGSVERDVRQRVDPRFEQGRRYGSGLHAAATTRELGSQAAQLAFANYGQERQAQQAAAAGAPALAQADYGDISQLMGVGGERQAMAQAPISEAIQRFNFEQQQPAQKLAQYGALIGGNYGGTTTGTQTTPVQGSNPFLTALGVGATGASVAGGLWGGANPLFDKPWG